LKYIARKDIEDLLDIDKSTASRRHKILTEDKLYLHPSEKVSRKEYEAKKQSCMGINFDKGGRPLILLSVDDAIMFISYGQSDIKKLETIKKLLRELNKYKNIAKNERKLRLLDCWRNIKHYDDIAYEWLLNKQNEEKIPLYHKDPDVRSAYRLLWDTEIWRVGKSELYRYLHLKGTKLPFYKNTRIHHEIYIWKHLFTKAEIIHKRDHKSGHIGKMKDFIKNVKLY